MWFLAKLEFTLRNNRSQNMKSTFNKSSSHSPSTILHVYMKSFYWGYWINILSNEGTKSQGLFDSVRLLNPQLNLPYIFVWSVKKNQWLVNHPVLCSANMEVIRLYTYITLIIRQITLVSIRGFLPSLDLLRMVIQKLQISRSFVCPSATLKQFIFAHQILKTYLEKLILTENFCRFFSFKSSDVKTTENLILFFNS